MKKRIYFLPLFFALLSAVASFVSLSFTRTAELEAGRLSAMLNRHMDRLDRYAERLLYEPEDAMDWPELSGFPEGSGIPEGMVLYKYVDDSLHSWYNTLSVNEDDMAEGRRGRYLSHRKYNMSFSVSAVGEKPVFVNLGDEWYVMKTVSRGKVRLLEALEISSGTYLNPHFRILPLCDEEGIAVTVDSSPVFKISEGGDILSSVSYTVSIYCRWLFFIFLAAFVLCFLLCNRSVLNCGLAIAALLGLAFASNRLALYLVNFSGFFSPSLYVHEDIFGTFAALICSNVAVALGGLCIYICREEFKSFCTNRPGLKLKAVILFFAVSSLFAGYILYTYINIIKYSPIELQLYKIKMLSVYSICTYASYILLLLSLLLVLETTLYVMRGSSMLALQWIVLYSTLSCAVLGFFTSYLGVDKEYDSVTSWCKSPSLERNAELESNLRQIEAEFKDNSRIAALCFDVNGRSVLQRRVEEMIIGYGKTDVRVEILEDVSIGEKIMSDELSEGMPVFPESSIIFNHHSGKPHYVAFLKYSDGRKGSRVLKIEIEQKELTHKSLGLSPQYSYARYCDGQIVYSIGEYPYSTDIDNIRIDYEQDRASVIIDGYMHYVTKVDGRSTIVVSRPTKNASVYALYYVYLVLALFLSLAPFIKKRGAGEEKGSFTWRIRFLVVSSLIVTMLVMLVFSLSFINRRNERNQENMMISRITYVQDELERYCSRMKDCREMTKSGFARAIKYNLFKTVKGELSLYTPRGEHLALNERYVFSPPERGRIEDEAYKRIFFDHKRSCAAKVSDGSGDSYILYAPICNRTGAVLAVAAVPYRQDDYEFTRDVVLHSASLGGLFILLFLLVITMTYSITSAIFLPLSRLTRRMKNADSGELEILEYRGDDEISVLVDSYNEMVMALRENTNRQMALERDRAWSEMARQVAHEIKNPLTPMKLEIQRLMHLRERNDPNWEDKFTSASKIILEHIDILTNTANDFSTFAKLYSENPVDLNLDEIVRNQILLFRGKENVKIEYDSVDDAIISGPKPQLVRVVLNLLTNACQAVEDGENPLIRISLEKDESRNGIVWRMSFEDNGPGVSEENVRKLFMPNFTTKNSGTGLGLAMCRNIVEKCGGTISYSRSETLGGACFTVVLPDGYSQI